MKKSKNKKTIIPLLDPNGSGKNKRVPKQNTCFYWQKGDSKFHN